ncbi:unnamed protein product, partial [Iphiclides podalirius]
MRGGDRFLPSPLTPRSPPSLSAVRILASGNETIPDLRQRTIPPIAARYSSLLGGGRPLPSPSSRVRMTF